MLAVLLWWNVYCGMVGGLVELGSGSGFGSGFGSGLRCFNLGTERAMAQVIHRSAEAEAQASLQMSAYIDKRTGDTIPYGYLRPVYCFSRKRFRSERHEREYWRMVNDVRKTLPIAKEAKRMLIETYETVKDIPNARDRDRHMKQLQKEVFDQYKPRLKQLNYRQGRLLVRLIDRECHAPSYQLISSFLGKGAATFWQGFGRVFGVNLKSEWDPDGKDRELENICLQVERGML
jgi:hypothetical protein